MKNIVMVVLVCLISACSMINNTGPMPSDRDSVGNKEACTDTYNDVNSACADSVVPQTY